MMSAEREQRVSRDSAEWENARETALRRDQYRCQHCDRREGKWGTDLQVHHIRPVKEGGSHDLNNLATLCNTCHWKLHRHHNDKDELHPRLLGEDRPTFAFPDSRVPLSNFNGCEREIVEILRENGPTQLKDIVEPMDYSRGYIQKSVKNLQIGKYVCRVSRGVYAYITELEYRRTQAREPDEYDRREVAVWDPGEQVEITEFDAMLDDE